jgi:hypothetical protein
MALQGLFLFFLGLSQLRTSSASYVKLYYTQLKISGFTCIQHGIEIVKRSWLKWHSLGHKLSSQVVIVVNIGCLLLCMTCLQCFMSTVTILRAEE